MTARIVETAADPTGEGVEIEMLAASAARRAFKPRPRLLVPRHQNGVPVDKNVEVCLASWYWDLIRVEH
jgi:hypothetical protein